MRSRVPLVGLLVLLGAVVCVVSVSGAGFTQSTSQRRHHVPQAKEGRGATFPTREEIAADPELARKYTGDNQLQIHVNCHTHDDVGWLKTVSRISHSYAREAKRACSGPHHCCALISSGGFVCVLCVPLWRW